MWAPSLAAPPPRSILCLGAHCDDIEIGCGATLLKLLGSGGPVRVDWIVLSSDHERALEARKSADQFLLHAAEKNVAVEQFRGSYLPYSGTEVKEYFDDLGKRLTPDLIFTHAGDDRHQDHRLVSELTWNTFRDHLILEYEIPKYDGDMGRPNVFVPVDRSLCEQKIATLMDVYASQHDKPWFSDETFWAMLRLRGVESRSATGYAEAFYGRKVVLS